MREFFSRLKSKFGKQGSWLRRVTDKEYMADSARHFQELREAQLPADLDDRTLRKWVEELLEHDLRPIVLRWLQLAEDRAVPYLINALKDARFHRGKMGDSWNSPSPFERVCELLEPYAPIEAVSLISPHITREDQFLRQTAAITLASFGLDESIEPVRSALGQLEEDWHHTREYALMGIERAIASDRATPAFRGVLFEVVAAPLDLNALEMKRVAHVLLLLDRERASAVLTSDSVLSLTAPGLAGVLKALNDHKVELSGDQLLSLLEGLRPLRDAYPHKRAYGEVLKALALIKHPACDAHIREGLECANKDISEAAAEALCLWKGLGDPHRRACALADELGFDELPGPLKLYLAVCGLDAEVNNGGFSQYFYNCAGSYSEVALRGLRELEAHARAGLLEAAMSVFGPEGPSADRSTRIEQLRLVPEDADNTLGELDSRYYALSESLGTQLLLFAIRHAEHFADPGEGSSVHTGDEDE